MCLTFRTVDDILGARSWIESVPEGWTVLMAPGVEKIKVIVQLLPLVRRCAVCNDQAWHRQPGREQRRTILPCLLGRIYAGVHMRGALTLRQDHVMSRLVRLLFGLAAFFCCGMVSLHLQPHATSFCSAESHVSWPSIVVHVGSLVAQDGVYEHCSPI